MKEIYLFNIKKALFHKPRRIQTWGARVYQNHGLAWAYSWKWSSSMDLRIYIPNL